MRRCIKLQRKLRNEGNIIPIKPKIALTIFEKNAQRYQCRPTLTKMRKMLKSSLESKMKLCKLISLKVTYGNKLSINNKIEEFNNFIETSDFGDLKGSFEDFTDKREWFVRNDINQPSFN